VFRTTQDVVEVRRWAEIHGARPCRDELTGRLLLAFPGEGGAFEVGWDEFEPTFLLNHDVFVCDDALGHTTNFIGGAAEAHAFLCGRRVDGPHAHG
jgi:hypothetical protein